RVALVITGVAGGNVSDREARINLQGVAVVSDGGGPVRLQDPGGTAVVLNCSPAGPRRQGDGLVEIGQGPSRVSLGEAREAARVEQPRGRGRRRRQEGQVEIGEGAR